MNTTTTGWAIQAAIAAAAAFLSLAWAPLPYRRRYVPRCVLWWRSWRRWLRAA